MAANQDLVNKLAELQAKADSIQSIDDPEDYAKALTDIDEKLMAVVTKLPQVLALCLSLVVCRGLIQLSDTAWLSDSESGSDAVAVSAFLMFTMI